MPDFKAGDVVGPWTLVADLGSGGNGSVWESARNGEGSNLAVKLPHRLSGEPHERFVREVKTQLECSDDPGVLPILDSHLPEAPSKEDWPWYAMPICQTADRALAGAGLPEVVAAMASIAEALGRLHERGISHRDVKPGNLYSYEGSWCVGDFGLVDVPDVGTLTLSGKPLGPRYFMPPELIAPGRVEDTRPADVFMVAKTLWVLATGQSYPFPGEQRADVVLYQLQTWVSFRRTQALDELIERCTHAVASDRPSMHQLAADLRAWQGLIEGEEPAERDATDALERLGRAVRPRIARDQRNAMLLERFRQLLNFSDELLQPLTSRLHEYASPESVSYDTTTEKLLKLFAGALGPKVVDHRSPCLRIRAGGDKALVLGVGRYFALTDDDNLHVGGVLYIDLQVGETTIHQGDQRIGRFVAPCDSLEAEQNVRAAAAAIEEIVDEWTERFTRQLEDWGAGT